MSKSGSGHKRGVTWPRGFRAAGGTCGIKESGAPDLALIVADQPCHAAGVFTRNRVPGAPVIVARRHLRRGVAQAIVCNSGCSNVMTGERGVHDAQTMCRAVAERLGGPSPNPRRVVPASTGVIGRPLPIEKIEAGVAALWPTLAAGERADTDAARAILTTDLASKLATRSVPIGEATVRLGGITKGSGMIAPNMATMLAFLTTDAAIEPAMLRDAMGHAADRTFNRISIDQDTSTSDMAIVLASGLAGHDAITQPGPDFEVFRDTLTELCADLAYQIVRDGEGVTRLFRVRVRGAASELDADRVGRTVVGSPLVKTAVHGGDPNWGRLVMAVGRSGAKVDPARLSISIGEVDVLVRGELAQPEPGKADARQRRLEKQMTMEQVRFVIDLGLGDGEAEWLGCDLSRDYIRINADYTT